MDSVESVETLGAIGRPINYAYQIFTLFLCVYAIAALGAAALFPISEDVREILGYVDWFVCAIFLLDFLRSLRLADHKWRYFYTWGWLDLLSSIPTVDALRIGRVARVVRIVRVLRALRATRMLVRRLVDHKASTGFYSVVAAAFSLVVFSAVAIITFEKEATGANITTAEDALWWAVATITTVGYGDCYPITGEGRFIASIMMTAGVGLFGSLSGVAAAWFMHTGTPSPKHSEPTK